MRKYAVIMQLPEGKLPGFYAQIIKALATKAQLFDREKELLIIDNMQKLPPIEQILEQYHIPYETIPLLHVPNSTILKAHYEDFGFTTRSGNTFLYEESIIIFTLEHEHMDCEDYEMALSQLDEHLIANFTTRGIQYFIAEMHLQDCFAGIAKAYQCKIKVNESIEGPLELPI